MARNPIYSPSEIDALETLPITIPEYTSSDPNSKGRSSPPFSTGQEKIEKYTQEALRKTTNQKSSRTDFFEKTLYGIWRRIDRMVPYAFRTADSKIRSLDAGCVGFLVNKPSPDLNLYFQDGFIVAVEPANRLRERYKILEQNLIDSVTPPPQHYAQHRPDPIVLPLTGSHALDSLESPTILNDIEAAAPELARVSETERDALIKARLGQGRFRADLIKYWSGCAVLGDLPTDFLLASHIKPWRASNNQERLDPYNGLLLSPTLNHAFDQGFISFAQNGEILRSRALNNESASLLCLHEGLRLRRLEARHQVYLRWHRTEVLRHWALASP